MARVEILKKYYDRNGGFIRAEDVGDAAREGDQSSIEIIRESGKMIGDVLAGLVNFYNPSMLIIGGGVSNIGNLLLSAIRQGVLNRSLPWQPGICRSSFPRSVRMQGLLVQLTWQLITYSRSLQ